MVPIRPGAAQDGRALELDAGGRRRTLGEPGDGIEHEVAGLPVERDGVVPQHLVDVVVGEAGGEHRVPGLRGLERVGAAPVRGGVHDHALRPVLPEQGDHAVLVHLGVGVDGEPGPRPGVAHEGDVGLVEVVDEHPFGRQPGLVHDVQGAARAGELVAVRGVHQDGELGVAGHLQLRGERLVLLGGHRVVADLADGDHAVLEQVAGDLGEHLAQRGSFASLGFSAMVAWCRMPNCAARNRSQPSRESK